MPRGKKGPAKRGRNTKAGAKKAKQPPKKRAREPESESDVEEETPPEASHDPGRVPEGEKAQGKGQGSEKGEFDPQEAALDFLVKHIPQSSANDHVNPAANWMIAAWDAVRNSRVRFLEEPTGDPYTWAEKRNDRKPRNLRILIWKGAESGVHLTLDKIAEAVKAPLQTRSIEELMAVCARISNAGISSNFHPATMTNLALHVLREHPSIKAALSSNTISDIDSLNHQLALIYSDHDLMGQYLRSVTRPKHRNCEEFHVFMKRCLTAYVSVSWYAKLDEVIVGIVGALPLNLWEDTAPVLVNSLVEIKDKPDLLQLGKVYLEHETYFQGLTKVEWDNGTKKHRLLDLTPTLRPTTRPDRDADRDQRRDPSNDRRDRDSGDRNRVTSGRTDRKSRTRSKSRPNPGKREREEPSRKPNVGSSDKPDVKCYACNKSGHIVPNCPDQVAKAAYDKKRASEKNSGGEAKVGSDKKVHFNKKKK